ncbi:MAG: hypothetical protein PVI74_02365, partial [Syntrophobacterales bacterium]
QEPIQIKFGLLFLPTLQYSNTPKVFALVPAEPLYSDPAPRTRFSMLNKPTKYIVESIGYRTPLSEHSVSTPGSSNVRANPNQSHD